MSLHDSCGKSLEECAQLARVLRSLPEEQRTALELMFLDGCALAEVALRLRCPELTVTGHLRRGLQAISSHLPNGSELPTLRLDPLDAVAESRLDAILQDYLNTRDPGSPLDRDRLQGHPADLACHLERVWAGMDRLLTWAHELCKGRLRQPEYPLPVSEDTVTLRAQPSGRGAARREIPDFQLQRVLGEGGMGIVYLAQQISLPRQVALKMIRSSLGGGVAALARFREEANAIARLNDPHIVQIHATGEHKGEPYFVLEYVAGGTLGDHLNQQVQPARLSAERVRILARTVHKVHQAGILHLDLKPGNVLVAEDGALKITDFGLSRFFADQPATQPSEVAGTPSYMAPEQARRGCTELGPCTDVWALGAILYEMLTGRPPFESGTASKTLELVLHADPVPVRSVNRSVPRDLEAIVHTCLQKDPAHRYSSAQVLAERLQMFLDGKPIPERPRSWLERLARLLTHRNTLILAGILFSIGLLLVLPQRSIPAVEEPRQTVVRTLAAGEPFLFEGTEPLPGPFVFRYGEPSLLARDEQEPFFSGSSHGTTLWELLPEVEHDRYEFSIEVRHTSVMQANSLVGLYFNYQEIPATEGRLARGSYLTLGFSEANAAALQKPMPPQAQSWVALNTRLFERRAIPYSPTGPVTGVPFVPANPLVGPGPWRKLRVVVQPDEVTVDWEATPGQREPIAVLPVQELADRLRELALSMPKLRDAPATFRPRSGLGLVVVRAGASFRNVRLTPILSNP